MAMLARVITIALNTYRESVRARILLGLAGVAFAVAFYSLIVGAFTLQEAPRVVADLGAAASSVFSIVVAILIGATSLHRELEQKTIFPLLARPIRRTEYLLGKYFGTLLVITVFILAQGGFLGHSPCSPADSSCPVRHRWSAT
jgi:Cu-processing system permease protein